MPYTRRTDQSWTASDTAVAGRVVVMPSSQRGYGGAAHWCGEREPGVVPSTTVPVRPRDGTVGGVLARTAWQALTQRPLRFLASSWPWRSLAYLLSGVLLGAGHRRRADRSWLLTGVLLAVVLVGPGVLLLGIAYSGIVVARFERWRLRLVDADPAPNPHRPVARCAGLAADPAARAGDLARARLHRAVHRSALWWIDLAMRRGDAGHPGRR